MRCVEVSVPGVIVRKLLQKELIDESHDVVILACGRNFCNQIDKVSYGFVSGTGVLTKFCKTAFKRTENALKNVVEIRIDVLIEMFN